MANAFSLNSSGAIPPITAAKPYSGPSISTNGTLNSNGTVGTPQSSSGLVSGGSNGTAQAPIYAGLLPAKQTAPTTPVKSISVTQPDGTNITTTHHAPPTVTAGDDSSSTGSTGTQPAPGIYSATTGLTAGGLNSSQVAQGYSTVPGSYNPVTGQPTASTTPGVLPNSNASQSTGNGNTAPVADGSVQGAAQGVYNAGQQTNNEAQTQGQVESNEGMTPEEAYYNNMAVTGQETQNINNLGQYAESQFYGQPGEQITPDTAAPDLAGRAAGTDALAGQLGNIYGSAAQTGYANALQQQNLGLNAAENAYSGAQTQAGRGQTSAADVLQTSVPQQYAAGSSTPYNPVTGQYGSIAGTTQNGGIASAGALGVQKSQGGDVQTMTGIQNQAQALGTQLTSLINSGGVNLANAGVLTQATNAVNQYLQGQAVSPQYQNFANLITEVASKYSNILNQSGGTPTDVSTVSHNIISGLGSGQSIEQVLSSLDQNATSSINALKSASQTNAVSGGSSSTNSSLYNF